MRVKAWLAGSLDRQYPLGPEGKTRRLRLAAARGERVSFQACVRPEGVQPVEVTARACGTGALAVEVRRVGCVPLPHFNTGTEPAELDGVGLIPGYVPDVLWPEERALAAPRETTAFWITVRVPRNARPGLSHVTVELAPKGGRPIRLGVETLISEAVLPRHRGFRMTHWFYADALCDWYRVRPFEPAFWRIARPYFENYAAHGNDTIYVPLFTPPLDGVKRPTQLLKVRRAAGGRWRFDWSDVRRWVQLAGECGIGHFEWTHLFTQWGCRRAIRIYERRDGCDRPLWRPETGATSPTYRRFLAAFLPAFHAFLRREGLLEKSFFHVSDEPHGDEHLDAYRRARALLRELAPWMRVCDALSDIRFGREHLTDLPVPSISTAQRFAAEGLSSWCYFCCNPRGRFLNRLLDTPLVKVRMSGWLFRRFGMRGFLHWGYNYWYKRQTTQLIDPFRVTDAEAWPGWAHGDPFVVYPGPDGPLDSIRWEVFAESMQDYALLEASGTAPDSPLLADIKGFDSFPKRASWISSARKRLLAGTG